MGALSRSHSVPTNRLRDYIFLFSVAVIARLVVWTLIPMDWNSDSYHHWQNIKTDILLKN